MFNDFEITDEDYEVPELGTDEDEIEEEEIVDESGTDLSYDNNMEEYLKEKEEVYYSNFPKIEEIYSEGRIIEDIPNNYNRNQQELFRKGIALIKDINERCGCSLTFTEIVNSLDQRYLRLQQHMPHNSTMFESMSSSLYGVAYSYALEMQERRSYANKPIKKVASELNQNFDQICKAVRLYALIHPEKFTREEGVPVSEYNEVFNSRGKLRTVFKKDGVKKFDSKDLASTFAKRVEDMEYSFFGSARTPKDPRVFIVDKINRIIGGKEQIPNSQGERVRKLAECVRILRPLQARRESRSVFEFLTNHKVYVAERDTLRQCKLEMQRLGLSKEEISKVLHGGSFNNVRFNDGLTVFTKLQHPEQIDTLPLCEPKPEEIKPNQPEQVQVSEPEKVNVNNNPVVNENRVEIVVDEVNNEELLGFNVDIREDQVIEEYIQIDNEVKKQII